MEGEVPASISFQMPVGRAVEAVLREHACLLGSCAMERLTAQMVVMNLQPVVSQQ